MKSREKLVGLVKNAMNAYGDGIKGCSREEFVADFLLAGKDVIVLPCEIGATVYIVWEKYRAGQTEVGLNKGRFRIDDIPKVGKSVFIKEEEAEACIAEKLRRDSRAYDIRKRMGAKTRCERY